MDFVTALAVATLVTIPFVIICVICLMLLTVTFGVAEDECLRTLCVTMVAVFILLTALFTNAIPRDEYLIMKNELETIQRAAVDAGLGHFKETVVVVETKKEFVIGSFTAEVIATGTTEVDSQ